jgi:MATE family multidrug resistance protein
MGASVLAEVWVFIGVAFLMGHFGAQALAAHQIAINIASGSFMVALGIANASTVRVGTALGQKKYTEARRAGLTGMILGIIFMGGFGLILWFFPTSLIGFYLDLSKPNHQNVLSLSTSLLRIAALFQIFDAIQVTSQGALRGLQDTRIPMLISLGSYAGIGLGSGLILAYGFSWRETGLWIGLTLGLLTSALTLSTRFLSYFIKHKSTQEEGEDVCWMQPDIHPSS